MRNVAARLHTLERHAAGARCTCVYLELWDEPGGCAAPAPSTCPHGRPWPYLVRLVLRLVPRGGQPEA